MHCFDTLTNAWIPLPEVEHTGTDRRPTVSSVSGSRRPVTPIAARGCKQPSHVRPSVRRGHSAVLHSIDLDPKIIVFGGMGYDAARGKDVVLGDTWMYDVRAHTWELFVATGMVRVCGMTRGAPRSPQTTPG